jgi:hypothetical protein
MEELPRGDEKLHECKARTIQARFTRISNPIASAKAMLGGVCGYEARYERILAEMCMGS